MPAKYHYILFNKPFGALSQFTPEGEKKCLKDFGPFPSCVYPVGRLDYDSEGMLLLTDDNLLKHRMLEPKFNHSKTYLVQVERIPTEQALDQLNKGVLIGGKKTKPAKALLLNSEPTVPLRSTPIRYRKNVPTAWIELTIYEGQNRQVRRMTAAVGHPALRLIRTQIGLLKLDGLEPGEYRILQKEQAYKTLME